MLLCSGEILTHSHMYIGTNLSATVYDNTALYMKQNFILYNNIDFKVICMCAYIHT